MYNPALGTFINLDPLESGSNFYAYCDDAPTDGTDPSGLGVLDDLLGGDTETLPPDVVGNLPRPIAAYEKCIADMVFYLVGHGSPDEFRTFLGNGEFSDNEHLQIVDDPAFFQGTEFGRENPIKVAVAKIAFAGDAAAITLGNRIYTKEFNYAGDRDRPCAISETERDAVGDASMIGHELTHVIQQLAAPITVDHAQNNFWVKYAADYAVNLAAGMPNKQAYENIPYEREAYAVGGTLRDFFSDKDNRKLFDDLCCTKKLQGILAGQADSALKTKLKALFKQNSDAVEAEYQKALKNAGH